MGKSSVVGTYDPSEVIASVGVSDIPSFESMTVEQDEDGWSFENGSNGETARARNRSTATTVTISLLQTSLSNDEMAVYYESGALVNVLVKDFNGLSLLSMPQGTIVKMATKTYGKAETSATEWMIKGPAVVNVTAGNS